MARQSITHCPDVLPATDLVACLRRLQETGSAEALEQLVVLIGGDVLRYIRRRLGQNMARRVDPLDVFQEVCLRLHRFHDRLKAQSVRDSWALLYRITRNELLRELNHHKAGKRSVEREESMAPGEHGGSAASPPPVVEPQVVSSPSRIMARGENVQIVQDCLDQLSESDRDLVRMMDIEQRDRDEVAAHFGISRDNLRTRHSRAMRRLLDLTSRHLSGPE